MLEYIVILRDFLAGINPIFILSVIYLLGLYVFWRSTAESRKNRSSVFDMFVFTGFLSVLVGRVMYIVVAWQEFANYIWYWLPYEKYGDKIFLFRLLPWRFFSIWDGQLIILAMFVSLILTGTFFAVVIKKWRWKHMFFPIYFSATTMLGFSFLFTGFVENVSDWIFKGLILIGILALFFAIYNFLTTILNTLLSKKLLIGYIGLFIVWLSTAYIGYIYMTSNLTMIENITVVIFLIWSLISGILFIIDLRKASVSIERLSNVRSVGQVGVGI